jgi:hypothetical protein
MKIMTTTDERLLSRVKLKLRQGICGLHGHDSLLHFDGGHVSLLCSSCGYESPDGMWAAPARLSRGVPAPELRWCICRTPANAASPRRRAAIRCPWVQHPLGRNETSTL